MKIPKPFLLLAAAVAAFGALTPSHGRAEVTVSFFYDTLDPYGEWVQTPDYGYCWHPTGVDDNWAPYTDGYWAYTDDGWTWVSYEDYGGVVYHYGRWARIPGEGWVWVPGNTWAPAWVSWRTGDDYVGWAPLPPEAEWRGGIGFGGWVDGRFDIGPGCYSFVRVGDFGAPALGAVILERGRNGTIINNTTNITNITYNNSNVYTGGPSYRTMSAHSTRPIPTLKLVRQSDVRAAGGKALSRQQGNQLMVLAPKITASAPGSEPTPSKVAKTLTGVKADHGWGVVKDAGEREKLQAKIKGESSETTPAKPVNPEDVSLVDEKIKSNPNPTKLPATTGLTSTKPQGKKTRTPSTEDLMNAPATEEQGTAAASETPKPGKKSKKSKTPGNYVSTGGEEGNSEATPKPKKSKSKKSRTPSEYDSSNSGYGSSDGEPTPSKHSKHSSSSNSNLEPFMGNGGGSGDSSSEPKSSKKSSDSYESQKNYESRSSDSEYGASAYRTPKSGKSSKSKSKSTPGQ